jgi:hypothetical protein
VVVARFDEPAAGGPPDTVGPRAGGTGVTGRAGMAVISARTAVAAARAYTRLAGGGR